jgi:hypothetical protein
VNLRERRDFILTRDLFYLRILEIFKRTLWERAVLIIGVPMEKENGAHFNGDFPRQIKEISGNGMTFSPWQLCERNLDGGLLYWEPLKGMSRKALETGISLHRGSFGELGRGLTYRGL